MEANSLTNKPHRGGIFALPRAIGFCLYIAATFFIANILVAFIGLGLDALSLNIVTKDTVLNAVFAAAVFSSMLIIVLGIERIITRRQILISKLIALQRSLQFSDIGLGILGLVPSFVLAAIFTASAVVLIPGFDVDQAQELGFSNVTVRFEYLLAFVTLVILAPLVEEIIFRGYLYGKLRQRSGPIISTILVSLVFAALHLQLNVAVIVFGLSLVLCTLREFTGSIWAGVILHGAKNGIAFYFLFVSPLLLQ